MEFSTYIYYNSLKAPSYFFLTPFLVQVALEQLVCVQSRQTEQTHTTCPHLRHTTAVSKGLWHLQHFFT